MVFQGVGESSLFNIELTKAIIGVLKADLVDNDEKQPCATISTMYIGAVFE